MFGLHSFDNYILMFRGNFYTNQNLGLRVVETWKVWKHAFQTVNVSMNIILGYKN